MLTSSGGCRSMLTVADRGGGGIFQNLADVICERSLSVWIKEHNCCNLA